MKLERHSIVWNIYLIIFICLNLANINAGRFDGEPPTEIVVATESPDETELTNESIPPVSVETEEPLTEEVIESEEIPVEEVPTTEEPVVEEVAATEEHLSEDLASEEAVDPEKEPIAELLSAVPENTDIIVLDENGEIVPLVEQKATDIILEEDPMWCPAGVMPGGPGCSTNYSNISSLITNMRNNTSAYEADGVIYFTAISGGSLELTNNFSSLRNADFNTLRVYNLTLQGGWNGVNGAGATFTGHTNFGTNTITIGESNSRWVGNITLNNFVFNGVSNGNAITIYTTSGDITLNNVDVAQQSGSDYTAYLDSNSGDITVQNSSFDGNNSGNNQNRGFRAETDSGAITITDTSFSDSRGCLSFFFFGCIIDEFVNYDGATLSAPTVTLTNVTADNNDLSGIQISDADMVTLNNVTATNNGTSSFFFNGFGSGVNVDGTGSTLVQVDGGTLSNNQTFGLSVFDGSITVYSHPTCNGNGDPGPNPSGCYNILPTVVEVDTPRGVDTPTIERERSGAGVTSTFTIPVTGSSLFDISCIDPATYILKPPGARITFINLCGYQAMLEEVLAAGLPGSLPSGTTFINGINVTVFQDGEPINPLPLDANILLDLPVPAGIEGEYTILHWDGSKWTKLDSQNNNNGFVEVASTQTGVFILVAK